MFRDDPSYCLPCRKSRQGSELEQLDNLFARLRTDLTSLEKELEGGTAVGEDSSRDFGRLYLKLLEHQRQILNEMNRSAEFDEDLIRKYLSLIDVEEYKIREKQLHETE